jgi:hypothetical protein
MAGKAQALTAQSIGNTDATSQMQDGGSYADEVAAMTSSARSPVAIAAGLGAGIAGYHFSRRLTMLPKGAAPRQITLASLGIASALVGHATTSWALYSFAPRPALSDYMAGTRHPITVGASVGAFGASLYGLYKWRNPPGATKQRWVLPLVGSIVAANIAGATAAAFVPKTQVNDNGLSGLLEFGSLTQTVVSAAAIVGIYGGIRYAYALHGKKAKRGLADNGSNTYEAELWVVTQPIQPKWKPDIPGAAYDGQWDSDVTGTPAEIVKAARALLKKSGAIGVAIIHNGEDVAYLPKGKAMEYHTVNFEPNITLRRKLQAVSGTKKTPARRGLSDCTPKLPTVAP